MSQQTNSSRHCRCEDTPEARYFTEKNTPHVHCHCGICEDKAVYPMTAWRHEQRAIRAKKTGKEINPDEDQRNLYIASANRNLAYGQEQQDDFDLEQQHDLDLEQQHDLDQEQEDDLELEQQDETDQIFAEDMDDNEADPNDADDEDNTEENMTNEQDNIEQFIIDAVLKLVEMKGKSGMSIAMLEDLLNWGKELHCHGHANENLSQLWPSSWQDVEFLLQRIGYNNPKLYWICLNKTHPNLFGLMESKDEQCPHCGQKGNIPYYYLSVVDKLKRWCSSPDMCTKMTMHWVEKSHWLPKERKVGWGYPLKKEMWDGTRFAELAFFWNPDVEWTLPTRCPAEGCNTVVCADILLKAEEHDGAQERRNVICPECGNMFIHTLQVTHGDPRNVAYIGHWDGWQPFSTTTRSCGAIEISVATMSKKERCKVTEVYVVGFVPSYLISSKSPISLDPFLAPLIQEIEEGFINGISVNYAIPICGKPAGPTILRHLILCWAGDHMGQCEVGKFIKCGKKGCRRCELESIYIEETSHYYYPEFRRQSRFPPARKCVLEYLQQLIEIEQEERITVKKEMAKQTGYTGLSILHRLYPLYGFLYDRDLVFDEMHTIQLNVVKKALSVLLNPDQNVAWQTVSDRLDAIPWTKELKSSRIPSKVTTRLGYWKAEEYSKFTFPASEVVFSGLLTDGQAREWSCLARIEEFIQRHARSGWSEADATTFHEIALRYAVLFEERCGPQQCVITLHNLLHFKDDINRHSGLDNYACWVQERAVRRYIRQANNHKNIECTFAAAELRREVLKFHRQTDTGEVALEPHLTDPQQLWAKSISVARKMHYMICGEPLVSQSGILVGGRRSYILSDADKRSIVAYCLRDGEVHVDVQPTGISCRSVWKANHAYNGLLYREKEHAIVISPEDGEIVVEFQHLFSVCINDRWTPFFKGIKYVYSGVADNGLMEVEASAQEVIGKMEDISRKIMLCPLNDVLVVIDFMRRLFPVGAGTVVVPCYPQVNDMVFVKGEGEHDVWRALVVSCNFRRKFITGRFFVQGGEFWIPEHDTRIETIWFPSITGLCDGHWVTEFTKWQQS